MLTSVERVNGRNFASYMLLYYIGVCFILQYLKCYLALFLAFYLTALFGQFLPSRKVLFDNAVHVGF